MIKRTLTIGLAAAGLVLLLASVEAAPIETAKPAPLMQSGPRIIHVPEPKRDVQRPHKKPDVAKPPVAESPATPSARRPVHTKANRKIWI